MAKKHSLNDTKIEYTVARRRVKYPRLEFKTGRLLLVLPEHQKNPAEIIEKHKDWIHEKNRIIQAALRDSKKKNLVERSEDKFKQLVNSIASNYSEEGDFHINHIYFRKMNSNWGSCSSKKNMTFNTLMRYLPQKMIDYIVYHELIHLKEKRHNEHFWKTISKKFPDYEKKEKELLTYWFQIQEIISSEITA
ncbi:MAG: M48 family metallopeptidase [Methanocellales archaeon]|nr:M48 family metallopeptidase [Methanocellales archaeon]MDD3291019.1 M48 family metallopeptidase [Methanocellales archaeon]MDD5234904.1 M48 family metallopeptidase [Methanocellales archaeon]MDD5484726.1 M48 family metallopeptidase [Methanocellales archaeon]